FKRGGAEIGSLSGPRGSDQGGAMRRGTRFQLAIVLMLARGFARAPLAQAPFPQDPTGPPGSTNDQKVVFTWASPSEPDSVNPMAGYSAIEFYFWDASLHLPVDFDVDFGRR